MKNYYSRIAATGSYSPEKTLSNKDLEKIVDTSDQWIVERTGIKNRHIMADEESASSMAEQASLKALAGAGLKPNAIDMVIVGTATPDRFFPSTACLLQKRLGINNQCMALDVSAACSGFIYGLSIADQYIKTGQIKTALVIGSEALTRLVDWQDRSTCILFSDGAGAVILHADEKPGILSTRLHADGHHSDLLYAANSIGDRRHEKPFLKMKGSEVFKLAVKALSDMVDETLKQNNLSRSDVDWLIPHQANLRIIKAIAKKLGLSLDRVVLNIAEQANTSSASIPLALDEAIRDGRIKRGEMLLMEAFGGGLTWGSALLRY